MLRYLSLDIICSEKGTDNVRGQVSEHIFAPNGDYCLYIFVPNDAIVYIYQCVLVCSRMLLVCSLTTRMYSCDTCMYSCVTGMYSCGVVVTILGICLAA